MNRALIKVIPRNASVRVIGALHTLEVRYQLLADCDSLLRTVAQLVQER